MSMFDACFVTACLSGASMYLLAWRIHRGKVEWSQIVEYMDKHVHSEEQEQHERNLHAQMVYARRRSAPRTDSGATARISKVSIARNVHDERLTRGRREK